MKFEVAFLGSSSLIVRIVSVDVDDDDELMLNVLRCQLTY